MTRNQRRDLSITIRVSRREYEQLVTMVESLGCGSTANLIRMSLASFGASAIPQPSDRLMQLSSRVARLESEVDLLFDLFDNSSSAAHNQD